MDAPLTLLYTGGIRGNLDLLPRLYTFLRRLRAAEFEDDEDVMMCAVQPSLRRTLLVDLGESCAPDVWHCAATGGRSTLTVLDAMGYDAANVAGTLAPDDRARLEATVNFKLVDVAHRYEKDGVRIGVEPFAGLSSGVEIVLKTGQSARIEGRALYPAAVRAVAVGVIQVSFVDGKPYLASASIFPLPPGTPPDPTIAATVDFVLGEARLFEKKRNTLTLRTRGEG